MGFFFRCRRVYIAYLDSVYFFQPSHFRTAVYHEILVGYLDYVKSLGWVFVTAVVVWRCELDLWNENIVMITPKLELVNHDIIQV